jgi:hypothetical protein
VPVPVEPVDCPFTHSSSSISNRQHQHQQQAKGESKQKGGSPFDGQSGKDLQTTLRHSPNAAKKDKTNTHGGLTVVARPTVVCKFGNGGGENGRMGERRGG